MAKNPTEEITAKTVIASALKSGLVNPQQKVSDIVASLGDDINEVAGYVVAWDKYVAVVAKVGDLTPEIKFRR